MKPILLMILICASTATASPLTLVLARATAADGGFVSLSQIATITGDDAEAAGRVLLGRAPGAGQSRSIDTGFIRTRLNESGIDTRKAAFYGHISPIVYGPGSSVPTDAGDYVAPPVTVTAPPAPADVADQPAASSAAQPAAANSDALNAVIATALEQILGQLTTQFGHLGTVHVAEAGRSRALLGLDGRALRLTDVTTRQRAASLGRLDYRLSVEVDGRPVHGLTLTVQAELERPVIVARRALPRGTVIATDDIELRTERVTTTAHAGFAETSQAVDLETRTALNPGEAVTPANTRPALLIRRGELVRVRFSLPSGGSVQVNATAQEDGAKGDVIRLRRQVEDGRPTDLTGRVTGRGECAAE